MSTLLLPPPTPKRSKTVVWILLALGGMFVIGGVFAMRAFVNSAPTKAMDDLFGDQHLKTAVALIELHKTRYGKYPDSIGDLKFTGQWDQIALQNVNYYPNPDRTAYYLEVRRGWIGKLDLEMPPEFWKGTGTTRSSSPRRRSSHSRLRDLFCHRRGADTGLDSCCDRGARSARMSEWRRNFFGERSSC
jgi:hypothetical protein